MPVQNLSSCRVLAGSAAIADQSAHGWRRLLALFAFLPALGWAQVSVDLVSRGERGDSGNGDSGARPLRAPARPVSDDGRFVVYSSNAANLVAGVADYNQDRDVFLFDRNLGTSQLVSHRGDSLTMAANGHSTPMAISGDGRWVVYHSEATDLVAGVSDSNDAADVFLYDRTDGSTRLVSRAATPASATANSYSSPIAISADGAWLLYYSSASNLVAGVTDTNQDVDLFLYDRTLGASRLVSHAGNSTSTAVHGDHWFADLSADGRWVAFTTTSANIVAGLSDGNNASDAFLYDRDSGARILVTRSASSATTSANSSGMAIALSADGRWVLYQSYASNVIAGQTEGNSGEDVFAFDRQTGTTTLVSHAAGSTTGSANNRSYPVDISDDGRWVLYYSSASNLIGAATISGTNAYLFDRTTGLAALVSHAGTPTTPAGLGIYKLLSLSGDGRFVLWNTNQAVVGGMTDGNFLDDVFLFDRQGSGNSLISSSASLPLSAANDESTPIGISADGSGIVFYSAATDLRADVSDINRADDLFLRDQAAGVTHLVSRAASAHPTTPNDSVAMQAISADGRYVLIDSRASNIVAGQRDTRLPDLDVFLHDTVTDANTLVSHSKSSATTAAGGQSGAHSLSADGRWALFTTGATDIANGISDSNSDADVYLFDRIGGLRTLVSHTANSPSTTANREAIGRAVSADGRWLLYDTEATNVIPGISDPSTFTNDVFLVDRLSGNRTLVSHAASSALIAANGSSRAIALSADGRYVLFRSYASNIVDGQIGSGAFLYDRESGSSVLASRTAGSAVTSLAIETDPLLSADGQTVVFASRTADPSSGISDLNGDDDVFLFDARDSTLTVVSRSAVVSGATGISWSRPTAVSADGRRVLFGSNATDLVSGAAFNGGVYVYDVPTRQTLQIAHAAASATTPANNSSQPGDISADGNLVLFNSLATDLLTGLSDANGTLDVYLSDIVSDTRTLVSRSVVSATTAANGMSGGGLLSADGSAALFASGAADLDADIDDGNQYLDLYLATLPRQAPLFADGFEQAPGSR